MRQTRRAIFLGVFLCGFLFVCSTRPEGVIVLCAGDSLTDSPYPRDLQRMLKARGYTTRVLNQGKIGHTSGEYLQFLLKRKESLALAHPDFILLQLGTNDVRTDGDFTPTDRFVQNMTEILNIFSGWKTRTGKIPGILVATIPPLPDDIPYPFSPASCERVEQEINPAIRRLAIEEGLTLVDNHGLFRESPHLLQDVHPTREGYKRLAQNWLQSLLPLLDR